MLIEAALAAEPAVRSPEGIAALGLDVRGLIFQIINFGILLLLLYRFAYKPLLRFLQERQQTIDESVRTAKQIERTRELVEEQQHTMLARARQEAEKIIDKSEQQAQAIREQAEVTGQTAAKHLEEQAQATIARETAEAKKQLKQEVLELVALASSRILMEKIDAAKDRALIEQSVRAAQQHQSAK